MGDGRDLPPRRLGDALSTRYEIAVTDPARDDLVAIQSRLRDKALFPDYPRRVQVELLTAIDSLVVFPERGTPRRGDLRILMTPSGYNVVYRVVGNMVEVLRIRHQRQRKAARP